MSNVESLALALLVSQHDTDLARQAQAEELAKLQAENARLRAEQRAANPSKAKGSKTPIHGSFASKGMLRAPTVESSREFLVTVRRATNRQETIQAIDKFVGYDQGGDFGQQDTRARSLAQRTLKPVSTKVPTRDEQRSAERSLSGFVHGLPDNVARHLSNLRAQAKKSVAALIEAEKTGNQVAAAVERERLNGECGIYAQIRAMGFEV
jgi:hypothetical protein